MSRICYLSGPITGNPDYKGDFEDAEAVMSEAGYTVLNPARMWPDGLSWAEYMERCLAVIGCADVVVLLPGWKYSKGSSLEASKAMALGKPLASLESYLWAGGAA